MKDKIIYRPLDLFEGKIKNKVMKKSVFAIVFSGCILLIIALTGCSKADIVKNAEDNSSVSDGTSEVVASSGSVKGTVLPPEAQAKISMIGNSSVILFLSEKGEILPNTVPAGDYTVMIQPSNEAYGSYVINDIRVISGAVTDLGTIVLLLIKG